MKALKRGFTLIEIITVITIIAVLIGILIPSITAIQKLARNTQQKAQINTIELAINAFKGDYGDYPASDWFNLSNGQQDYSGAQMLAEALLGWDLLGFHPKSEWRADGKYDDGTNTNADLYERATNTALYSQADREANLNERKGPYLDRSQTQVAHLNNLFNISPSNTPPPQGLEGAKTYVICDVYKFKRMADVSGNVKWYGAPIIYYKAKTANMTIESSVELLHENKRYDYQDNEDLIIAKGFEDGEMAGIANKPHAWSFDYNFYGEGAGLNYKYSIRDPLITASGLPWPYKPDSYLLISAGADGEYGTEDDITNFR